MNNNTQKNEGFFDRALAGWAGVQKAASNIGATAAGTPTKITSVQDAKIKQLFNLAQSRMKPFVKNLKSSNIVSKTSAEIEVKKQLLGFFQDFMKMTGEKKPNNIIATLQQPQYKDIADYLVKIGISVPTSSKKTSSAPASAPASKPTAAITSPKHAAKFNGFVFDDTTKLWSDPKGNVLNTTDSTTKTAEYIKAYNAGKIDKKGNLIPENINKITYKEFFV